MENVVPEEGSNLANNRAEVFYPSQGGLAAVWQRSCDAAADETGLNAADLSFRRRRWFRMAGGKHLGLITIDFGCETLPPSSASQSLSVHVINRLEGKSHWRWVQG